MQIVRSTNPKHFELMLNNLHKKGWWTDGKIKVVKVKGVQTFEATLKRKKEA